MRLLRLLLGYIFAASALASGPENIALIDDSFWPAPINSTQTFDQASRAEVLAFTQALSEFASTPTDQRAAQLKLKDIDQASIDKWLAKTQQILLKNFLIGAASCSSNGLFCGNPSTFSDLQTLSQKQMQELDNTYSTWWNSALNFHRRYLFEQLRLAALFPRISSEISTYSSSEITGFELQDRQFLLTFDDGPTGPNGNTDLLLSILQKRQTSGAFFLLGDRLNERLTKTTAATLNNAYNGMCVASHGMEHQSHARWSFWRESMQSSAEIIHTAFGDKFLNWFRPPYGQRLPESVGFIYDKNVLWNIDSQDWSSKISAHQSEMRVFKLMLLWRRGIILFHDIHSKAQTAVPSLLDRSNNTGIDWVDCKTMKPIPKNAAT